MNTCLIETDWSINALRRKAGAVETLLALGPSGLAVSVITYGELYHGAYHTKRDRQAALAKLGQYLDGFEVLPVNREVAEIFGILRGGLAPAQQTGHRQHGPPDCRHRARAQPGPRDE